MSARVPSRASATLVTPMVGCRCAPNDAARAAPLVTALKTVVLPLRGRPTMASSISVGFSRAPIAGAALRYCHGTMS